MLAEPERWGKHVDIDAVTKLYHPTMASAITCLPVPSLELRYGESWKLGHRA